MAFGLQTLGNSLESIGRAFNLPEANIGERLRGWGNTAPIMRTSPENLRRISSAQADRPTTTPTNNQTNRTQVFSPNSSSNSSQTVSNPGQDYQNPPSPDYAAIENFYKPLLEQLEAQRLQQDQFYTQEKSTLEARKQQDLERLLGQSQESKALLNQQGEQLGMSKTSALNEAVNAYNALRQSGQVLYGNVSSAGQAIGELASKAFAKSQGQILQTYARNEQELMNSVRQAERYFMETEQDLENKYQDAFGNLLRQFNDAQNSIRSAKTEIGMNKAKAQMEAKERYENLVTQLFNQRQSELNQLAYMREQLDMELSAQYKNLVSQQYRTPQNVFQGDQSEISFNPYTEMTDSNVALMRAKRAKAGLSEEDDQDFNNSSYFFA